MTGEGARHRPRIHRAEVIRLHGSPGEAISLDEYIERACREFSAADLLTLRGFGAQIEQKLGSATARQHHDLQENVRCLFRVVTSAPLDALGDPLPRTYAEAGVAIEYFLKGVDLIPDSVPEIGLTDDARLVARVIARNPGMEAI